MDQNNTDAEMQALLNESTDPVSGNDVPLGAKPEEVRDDIDAKVSENEYVIPAYAVRYFGPRFFDELLASAQQGWERIKEGEEPMPDTEMPEPTEREMEFAEGGAVPKPVGGGYGGYGGTGAGFGGFESKTYVNDDTGQEIIIYFYNGKPMSRVPEGFREKAATAVEEQQQAQQEEERQDSDVLVDEEQTWRNTPVEQWTPELYNDYGDYVKDRMDKGVSLYKLSKAERAIVGGIGGLLGGPLGAIAAIKLAEKANVMQADRVANSINEIVSTGALPSGEKLTQDVVDSLTANKFLADSVRAESDPYGQTIGVSITDQPFYRTSTGELDIGALMPPGTPVTASGAAVTGAASKQTTSIMPPAATAPLSAVKTPSSDDGPGMTIGTPLSPKQDIASLMPPASIASSPPPAAPRPAAPPPAPLPPATTYSDDNDDYDPFGMTYGTPLSASDFDESWMPPAADDSNDKEDSKIVCTAMNASYGFGSYRQAIWLSYSQKFLTKEHEVGYHTLFLPLVDLAYNKNNMFVRKILENIARHRTKDLRAEMQNGKRDLIGRAYRSVLEPLCYIVGKVKLTMATQ